MLAVACPKSRLPASRSPASTLLEYQGLAVLRSGDRYASLECGLLGGGHGHPDRLHLTLHQDGVHWLPDPGTGCYVSRDLFWYRCTLAHNAPRIDGVSQVPGNATCDCVRCGGRSGPGSVAGLATPAAPSSPDPVTSSTSSRCRPRTSHSLELPWHLAGEWEILSDGEWSPATLENEFISGVERFDPVGAGPDSRPRDIR